MSENIPHTQRWVRHLTACALIAGLISLSGCAGVPRQALEAGPTYSRQALNPQHISLLNWNIRKGLSANWEQLFAGGHFREYLQGTDLVLIQEACVQPPDTLPIIGPALQRNGFGWQFSTSFVSALWGCGNGNTNGVMTASRTKPLRVQALRSQGSEFLITHKASLALEFPIAQSAHTLLLVNTHLLNFEVFLQTDYEAQLQALAALIAVHTGPVIFAGDFNTRNQSRIDALGRVMAKTCLQPLHPASPDTRTRDRLHNRHVLDHILYRGLVPLAPMAIGQEAETGISDHNSMAAVFRLAAQQPTCGHRPE